MVDILKPDIPEKLAYTNPIEQRRNAVTTFSQKLLAQLVQMTSPEVLVEPLQQKVDTFLVNKNEEALQDTEFSYLADVARIAAFYTDHPEVEVPEEMIVTQMNSSYIDADSLGSKGVHTKFLFALPGNGVNITIDAKRSHVYLGGDVGDLKGFDYVRGKIRGADAVLIGRKMARTNILGSKFVGIIGGDFWVSHGEQNPYGWSGEITAGEIFLDKGNIYAQSIRSDTKQHDLHTQVGCSTFTMAENAGIVGENVFISTDNFIKRGGEFHGWFAYNGDEESWKEFNDQRTLYDQDKEHRSPVYTIDLGKASAFIIRPHKQLPLEEYIDLINNLNKNGALAFGRNEGTEIGGFLMQPKEAFRLLDALQENADIAIGIPTHGNSYIQWSWDNSVASCGCEALVAAARGLQSQNKGDQTSVWQLVSASESTPGSIEGYKATQLLKPTINESIQIARSVDKEIQDTMQTVTSESILTNREFEKLYAIKVDVNDFTKTLLSLDLKGQNNFLQGVATFLSTLEKRLRDYTQQQGSGEILFGENTDALSFYLTNPFTRRAVEQILTDLLLEQPLSIKTVAVIKKDAELTLEKKTNGLERVIYAKSPITDKEWYEKEEVVRRQGFPPNKIYFGEI